MVSDVQAGPSASPLRSSLHTWRAAQPRVAQWRFPIPVQPMWNSDPALSGPVRNYNGNGRYTFNNFITGGFQPSCPTLQPARYPINPGVQYNPLFIYAGVGLGKTHLLHAIASSVSEQGVTPSIRHHRASSPTTLSSPFDRGERRNSAPSIAAQSSSSSTTSSFFPARSRPKKGLFHTFNDPAQRQPANRRRLRSTANIGLTAGRQGYVPGSSGVSLLIFKSLTWKLGLPYFSIRLRLRTPLSRKRPHLR